MTAYSVTRPEDHDRTAGPVVVIPSRLELQAENERLRVELQRVHQVAESRRGWREKWEAESALRLLAQHRLNKAMRVLASIGRVHPFVGDLVARGRREIWGLDS